MSRHHAQRRHQDPLCLFLADRLAAPTLPLRPFPDRGLQADDVPHARACRTAEAAQRIERGADATVGIELADGKVVHINSAAWQSIATQARESKRAMMNCFWNARAASCIAFVIVPACSIRPSVSTTR